MKEKNKCYIIKNKKGFQKGHRWFGGGFKKGHTPTNKLKRISRICPVCSTIYKVPIHKSIGAGYRKYCCKKCRDIDRIGKRPWNKNKKTGVIPKTAFKKNYIPWNKGLTKKDPRILKMIITRIKTDGYKLSEKAKTKIRKKRAKQKTIYSNTKIEIILQNLLKNEKIKYKTQIHTLIGTPDIFIEPNICIFADGDYWHNREEAKKKDKIVNKELQKRGYVVLRYWEHDIKEKPTKCLRNILKYIK